MREFPHTAATIIVVGNEKGGSGKTTTAMHIVSALLRRGFRVGTLDLDIRQQSFSRYLRNRSKLLQKLAINLPMPDHSSFKPISNDPFPLVNTVKTMCDHNDFVIIDCPGNDTTLTRTAHSYASIVITPINDSLLDLDVVADLDDRGDYLGPGVYAEMVLGQRRRRLDSWQLPQEWVIVRNRLSQIGDSNKRYLADKLDQLSGVMGFRVTSGLSERVVFRQMFAAGLTVFDLDEAALGMPKAGSHLKAMAEVNELVQAACQSGLYVAVPGGRLTRA